MSRAKIAAFDFDGTLTYKDTLIPFLAHVSGKVGLCRSLLATSPSLAQYALGIMTNGSAKERLVGNALKGQNYSKLQELAESWSLGIHMQPKTLEQLDHHKKLGHYCILVSASLDVYLQCVAARLGFDALVCTKLGVMPDGTLTGKFSTPNCWGDEKVKRLIEIIGPLENVELYAYGDSSGDAAMLQAATSGWLKGVPFKR